MHILITFLVNTVFFIIIRFLEALFSDINLNTCALMIKIVAFLGPMFDLRVVISTMATFKVQKLCVVGLCLRPLKYNTVELFLFHLLIDLLFKPISWRPNQDVSRARECESEIKTFLII